MKTKLYVPPQMDVVQMHLDQTVLVGSSPIQSSDEGGLSLTLKDYGDETAW